MPVRHSLSPVIHNAAFAALGLDWVYVALEVDEAGIAGALAGMRALHLGGLNVTMPHKEAVARAVDRLSPTAEALGAANTVVLDDGNLRGENTDGGGFVDALRDEGFEPSGRSCGVVGAGGAARAVIQALADEGAAEIVIVNRTPERAERAVVHAGPAGRIGVSDDLGGVDLVVHATPVGMAGAGAADELALPADLFSPGQLVCDLVYSPLETPLLRAARQRGAAVANGVGMLIHQAARSFVLWTGEPAPVASMRAAVEARLSR
jgi:shikimate dehydrogenase